MANILLTGIATLDIINQVSHYPDENEEIRADNQYLRRGGNAANSADVLNQYNHNVSLACSLANDVSGQFIHHDLQHRGITLLPEVPSIISATPTSYITLNTSNGSRTIIHHRNLAELSFSHFDCIDLHHFDWFHFEGRNIYQTQLMMSKAILHNKPISLELEKPRNDGDILCLLPLANVLMISRPFALSQGFLSAKDCLGYFSAKYSDKIISCSWGDEGAWITNNNIIYHAPAHSLTQIIDTIGAGDTLNAALINALLNHQSIEDAIYSASKLAGLKCAQIGFENLVSKSEI